MSGIYCGFGFFNGVFVGTLLCVAGFAFGYLWSQLDHTQEEENE